MRYIADIPIGHKFTTNTGREGVIIAKSPRTLTAKFEKSTCKLTFKRADCEYPLKEFNTNL